MGCCHLVRLRLPDDTPGGRRYRHNRLAAETQPSVGFPRGLKRGRIGISPDEVCAEKKLKRVAMAGFVKKRCLALMDVLIDHPYGEVFSDVDTLASIPIHGAEYMKGLIKRMDLSTIKIGLEKGDYSAIESFVGDVRLIFSNALMFFPVENDVHTIAKRMSRDFEIELKRAMSEINTNSRENISDRGSEKSASLQGFSDSAKQTSPIKGRKTALESTGATPPRAALLKARFKETILRAETSLLGNVEGKKLKEMKRNREREAAREALRKMENSAKTNDIAEQKALKELEYLCGNPLSDYFGRKILPRLGLFLKDEASELD